jgi:inosine-uridine nucleoside N-ribohydrolase
VLLVGLGRESYTAARMARKVIIDCDPGIDDAVALCLALFDPRVDVVAVTAVAGNIPAEQASRNVQAIVDQLDPPRFPRIGTAMSVDDVPAVDGSSLHGADGLGNAGYEVARLHQQHPSDKLICDEVRAAPDEVSVLCLGPLTNVAKALKRDPEMANLVSRIIVVGGSVSVGGNVTPAAEFNMYGDPPSARTVFRSLTTKSLIPLDVTQQVPFMMSLLDEIPGEETRAGKMLRKILPYSFRAHHQELGLESVRLHGVVGLLAVLQPELFELRYMAGDVETRGTLTKGATIFDRRPKSLWRVNMEVAMELDAAAARDCIVRGLQDAGKQT